MIYLNTPVSTLGRSNAIALTRRTLKWCERTLGTNGRKRYRLRAYVRRGPDDDDICGEYDCWDNEIYIYWDKCDTVRELISTCIHEWTHSLQPILTKYYKYPGTYSRNPYERQARYNEKKWTPICWKEIRTGYMKKQNL